MPVDTLLEARLTLRAPSRPKPVTLDRLDRTLAID